MPIPKYDQIRPAALQLLAKRDTLQLREFYDPLAEVFGLTQEEKNEKYPSGNGFIFQDRVSWALSYLNLAGLVDKPKRGVYKINGTSKALLGTPEKINDYIDRKIAERDPEKKEKQTTEEQLSIHEPSTTSTPQEKLYSSFENIKKAAYKEILSTILSKSPTAFEQLVVQLLQKMGYGGEIEGAAIVTSAGNDGGIDGIIKEDVLGLGRIHIQAKRYALANSVQRPEIQGFVGALAVAQSNKGVFITTSYFSEGALQYAANLNGATSLVLLDGKQLAEYIYNYGLGMQVEQTIELKRMDADFWDEMADA